MAEIVMTVDTENKSFTATINGTPIANVKQASVYQYRDSSDNVNGIDVSIGVSEKQADDVRKETTYYAMGTAQAEKVMKSNKVVYNKDVPDFVGITTQSQAQIDIEAFLSTKLGK